MVKVVKTNKDGKVELTPEELEELLNKAYARGRSDGAIVCVPTVTAPPIQEPIPWWVNRPPTITCKGG